MNCKDRSRYKIGIVTAKMCVAGRAVIDSGSGSKV